MRVRVHINKDNTGDSGNIHSGIEFASRRGRVMEPRERLMMNDFERELEFGSGGFWEWVLSKVKNINCNCICYREGDTKGTAYSARKSF